MSRARCHVLAAALAALCALHLLGSLGAAAAGEADGSPLATLEAQTEAILAASTLDEVLHLLPAEHAARVAGLTAEQKAAGLEKWKLDVERQRPVAERVEGDRAVVLLEPSPLPDVPGARLLTLSRVDGVWRVGGEAGLMSAVPGATAGFAISGATSEELDEGRVSLSALNGIPTLQISDLLAEHLDEGAEVARVQIPFAAEHAGTCFEPGSYPIGSVVVEGEYGFRVPGGFWPAGAEEGGAFDEEASGMLEVTEVVGARFSGAFELTAASEDGSTVTVTGTIDRALMPCAF